MNDGVVIQTLHRGMIPVDARFNDAVDRLQEIRAMGLNVEPDQIGAEQAIYQISLPWTNPERLWIRPGDVPEDCDSRLRPLLLDHPREQREVIVLHQNDRPRSV